MSQVILFDLDGTLTDSGEGIMKSVQYALEKMGAPEEHFDNLRSFVGPPLKEQFMEYRGWDEDKAQQAVRYYRERYTEKGIFENQLYPKIPELLEILTINDKILGVATSKPEMFAEQILEGFGIRQYFQAVVGAELEGRRTQKAEVIEEALNRLGVGQQRDQVLMVGDKSHDVIGATACGIQCIGVTYGYGTEEELQEAGAVYIAHSVEDLGILASPNDEETTEHVESVRRNENGHLAVQYADGQEEASGYVDETPIDNAVIPDPDSYPPVASESYTNMENRPKKITFGFVLYQFWRVIYPVLIHYGISLFLSILLVIYCIVQMIRGNLTDTQADNLVNQSAIALTLATSVIAILILYFIYRSDQRKRREGYSGSGKAFVWAPPVIWISTIIAAIVTCQFLNDLITVINLNDVFPSYGELQEQTMSGQPLWLLVLTVGFVGPMAEELVFRGLVFHRLKDLMKPWIAIVISSLFFGAYHGNMVQFIYASIIGMLLAYLYNKTGTLWISILAHVTANLWSIFGVGLMDYYIGQISHGFLLSVLIEIVFSVVPFYWLLAYKRTKRPGKKKAAIE